MSVEQCDPFWLCRYFGLAYVRHTRFQLAANSSGLCSPLSTRCGCPPTSQSRHPPHGSAPVDRAAPGRRRRRCTMADVGASKEMLLHQLNALMADAAGDAETMELYQAKLAELDAARRANAELEQQLLNEASRRRTCRGNSRLLRLMPRPPPIHYDQLQTALADKVELRAHIGILLGTRSNGRRPRRAALGDLERSNQEVDSLREELREMRRRVQAPEDAGSEAQKVLHGP